jgi:hypothetical protein
MRSFLNISPEEQSKTGGGDDPNNPFPTPTLAQQGLLVLAFGFALGLTLIIFFMLFKFSGWTSLPKIVEDWVANTHPNLWISFLIGFIGGTLLAGIYNFLIFRRINLFGLDRNLD